VAAPDILNLDHEEWAWLVWTNPSGALKELSPQRSVPLLKRGLLHARQAVAWSGLLCLAEAKREAEEALASGVLHDPEAHASSLGVLALTEVHSNISHALELWEKQLTVIWRSGLVLTDIHVTALTNMGAGLSVIERDDDGRSKLVEAERAWRATSYNNTRLRDSRGLLIRYNRAGSSAGTDVQRLRELHQVIDAAEALGHREISALAHMSLSTIYHGRDLYSPSLVHAAIATELWSLCERPERRAEVQLGRSDTLSSLGLMREAEQLLDDVDGAGVGSRSAYIESHRLSQLADIARYRGEPESAARLAVESARAMPTRTLGDQWAGVRAWLIAALHLHVTPVSDLLDEAMRELRHAVRALESGPRRALAEVLVAGLDGGPEAFSEQLASFRKAWPDFPVRDGEGLDALLATVKAVIWNETAGDELTTDLIEYWGHIQHMSNEDDELVRARYRTANALPALHQILTRHHGALSAELQFELVELVRFAAVSALLALPGSVSGEPSLRRLARDHLQAAGMRFPAVYGEPRPLAFGVRSTPLAEIAQQAPLDVSILLSQRSHAEPDVLQLYLRGSTLHWFYRDRQGLLSGRAPVSPSALRVITSFRAFATPRIGPFEAHVAAAAGLAAQELAVVAAARTAVGPFGGMRDVAADLLCYLPASRRERVWRALADLDLPTPSDVGYALGELVPDCVLGPTRRELFVSTDLELATLPFVLANRAEWREPLLARRYPLVLPPLNLLAAAPPPNDDDKGEWSVTRIGNALGDLSFAGRRSSTNELARAIMIEDGAVAARSALVYRGHLAEPPPGRPSESGLYGGPGQVLRAHTLLEDPRPWRTPARLALLACRAAGWDLGSEWGGIAAAAMLRGTLDVIAPLWPLIDAPPAQVLDDRLARLVASPGSLTSTVWNETLDQYENWFSSQSSASPPHWWASLVLMSR
jgi:hypothetical protein